MSRGLVAVLDLGRTSLRVVTLGPEGEVVAEHRAASPVRPGPPYPHLDLEAALEELLAGLTLAARAGEVEAVVPVAHGAALALLAGDELVLPVMDYETPLDSPPRSEEAWRETLSPALPGGLNLANQLLHLEREHPAELARADRALLLPQYLAWRLGGRPACEVTSLGCHTHLWDPRRGRFSALAREHGWDALFPPRADAWETLGTVSPAAAERTGLPPSARILCGIHDSNASYLVHRAGREAPFAVVSTGTWVVVLAAGADLDRLDPREDMLAGVDATGAPVATMRFHGGRRHAERLEREGAAAAARDAALEIDRCLERLGARGEVIVEGPMARNEELLTDLAALRAPGRVLASDDPTGTAGGALRLARWGQGAPAAALREVPVTARPGLEDERARRRAEP